MSATVNQDFTVFAGDGAVPIFTITDGNGNVLDLSTLSNITWTATRNLDVAAPPVAPVLSKSLGSGITLIGSGSTGQFALTLAPSDTATLTLAYIHTAVVFDDLGVPTTVATGQMFVRPKPVSTYSGDPSQSVRDMARTLVGDTDMDAALFTDSVYDAMATSFGGPLYVAAQLCRMLAQRYAGKATKRVGDFTINYSDLAKSYRSMAAEFQAQADRGGSAGIVYAAGTSKADSALYRPCTNPDVRGCFTTMDSFDNKGASGGFMPPNAESGDGED